MGDWGIKISKPGQDVNTAADKDLLYTSKDTALKIDVDLSAKRTTDGGGSGNFNHNYGYTPVFLSYYKAGGVWRSDRFFDNSVTADDTTLYFSGAAGADFREFIFVDDTGI